MVQEVERLDQGKGYTAEVEQVQAVVDMDQTWLVELD